MAENLQTCTISEIHASFVECLSSGNGWVRADLPQKDEERRQQNAALVDGTPERCCLSAQVQQQLLRSWHCSHNTEGVWHFIALPFLCLVPPSRIRSSITLLRTSTSLWAKSHRPIITCITDHGQFNAGDYGQIHTGQRGRFILDSDPGLVN